MARLLYPAIAIGLLLPAASHAGTTYVSQEGNWRLNLTESKHAEGDPISKESVIHVTKDDGKSLQFTQAVTSATDQKEDLAFDGAYDGKQYPTAKGSWMLFHHVAADSFSDAGQRADGWSWKEICTISADHAKFTCKGADKDKAGKSYPYVEIWDKT